MLRRLGRPLPGDRQEGAHVVRPRFRLDHGHGGRAADFAVEVRERGVLTELDRRRFEQLC